MANIVESLHPFEIKVLPLVAKKPLLQELANASGLQEVQAMRALQWLENKGLVKISTEVKQVVDLDVNAKKYKKAGLPERRFLDAVKAKPLALDDVAKKAGLDKDEANACVGLLKKKAAIDVKKDKQLIISITDAGKKLLTSGFLEEKFCVDSLKKRKGFIKLETARLKSAELTPEGKKIAKELVDKKITASSFIDAITPEMLREGAWKGAAFRRYDVKVNVPKVYGGKLQPYRAYLDWVKEKFANLGFKEMTGPLVESDFWDMDALYMPQFHSARDIHDAYYIKGMKAKDVPAAILKKVKAAHENGGDTGSAGWRYSFDAERTLNMLLRTQGTACSARMLASGKAEVPGMYFGLARCFRYDVIDATHLPDFNQTEGIVIGEGLNMRHLIGLLKMFAKEFADTEEVKVVPAYFPFTEPSAELFAKHPKLGWIELGGAGIFRPELVKPLLGKYIPVLAWGLGIDRIAMLKLGINDIRDMFSHDLDKLRSSRLV
ncbi:phenylalanine--tRNA ligase subunit alpha [Candidatus Woesearchaeota archaeon]|nr:phenylalanine--tRNA ligase subunit alpha [Candidatus Woesearchaeota archaeon]